MAEQTAAARMVQVHLSVAVPESDDRDADSIARTVIDAFEVGSDHDSARDLSIVVAQAEEAPAEPELHPHTGWTEYDAAVYLLRDPLIARRTAKHIGERSIAFDALLEESLSWSHGERMLVEAALALWNTYYSEAPLGALVATLDEERLGRVLVAIRIRRRLS